MRRSMEENKFVVEQSVDGMDLAVGAYFRYEWPLTGHL